MRKGQAGALAFVAVLAGVVALSTEGDRAENALGRLTAAIDPHTRAVTERVAPRPRGGTGAVAPEERGAQSDTTEGRENAGDSRQEATDTAAISGAPQGPATGRRAAVPGGDDAAPDRQGASGEEVTRVTEEPRPEAGGGAGPVAADDKPDAAVVAHDRPVDPAKQRSPTAMSDQAAGAAPMAAGPLQAGPAQADRSAEAVEGEATLGHAHDARPDPAGALAGSADERSIAPSVSPSAAAPTGGDTAAGGAEVQVSGDGETKPQTRGAAAEAVTESTSTRAEALAEAAAEQEAAPDATPGPGTGGAGAPTVGSGAVADATFPPAQAVDRSGERVAAPIQSADGTPVAASLDNAAAARRAVEAADATLPIIGAAAPKVASSPVVKVAVVAAPVATTPVARPVAGSDAGAPAGEAVVPRGVPLRPLSEPARASVAPALAPIAATAADPAITRVAVARPSVAIESVEVVPTGLRITGRAAGEGDVRIYVDGAFKGDVPTARDHTFTFEAGDPPPPGTYRIRADQIGERSGGVASQAEVRFRYVDLDRLAPRAGTDGGLAPPRPGSHRVVIERGDNLWTIAADHYGDGFRYTTIFRANFVQIAHPDLIFPGQVFDLPGAAPASDTAEPREAAR